MGPDFFINLIVIFGVILLSMTLHEAMHAFVAYWLGDDTARLEGRLTLNPIKHIDPFLTLLLPLGLALVGGPIFGGAKPVPFRPDQVKWGDYGAALVALGGPLTNLFIAFLSYGVWVLAGSPTDGFLGLLFATMVKVNLGFFVFNILPIPPLDGSRVLYAVAPEFVRTGMRYIERYGIFIVFLLVLVAGQALGVYMSEVINFFLTLFDHIFRV
ncbi:MAG: site-2 protease family protein [Candidatus Saccharimonadaceae bacterium]